MIDRLATYVCSEKWTNCQNRVLRVPLTAVLGGLGSVQMGRGCSSERLLKVELGFERWCRARAAVAAEQYPSWERE